ncbi:hypothetical protein ACE38V_01345 [Cytobacillus sp. Hz8]|uniref:hypothetical protein n=1 Tax=Cytobacillus sp. Hz8 TaxID=3347168 RepID=UPI0035DF6A80
MKKNYKIQNEYREIIKQKREEKKHTKEILMVVIILISIILLFTFFKYNPVENKNLIKIEKIK